MSTNTKLAEALRLAREWFRHEEAGEGPQVHDVIEAADEALAAHEAEQALPLKDRPDFIAGYDAGLKDGRACERRDAAEQAAQAVPAGFKLVPVEPTPEMLKAAHDWSGHALSVARYHAMLAAAPTPPAPEAQQPAGQEQDERAAFEAAYKHLHLESAPDVWGNRTYRHSNVEALWEGWKIGRAALAQRREPLQDSTLWGMWVDSPSDVLAFARRIERHYGIGATTGEQQR